MNTKWFLALTVCMIICVLSPFAALSAGNADGEEGTFVFPSSLVSIEEEAFEGTAVETVIFPDGLKSIGPKAFEDDYDLKNVYIPDTAIYIADSAFPVTPGLTIHGIDGSAARAWAFMHQVPFVVEDVWGGAAQNGNVQNMRTDPMDQAAAIVFLIVLFEFLGLACYEIRSRQPQDQPEFYPLDYRFP